MGVGVWAATWVSQELSVTHGEEPWEGPDRKEEFSLGVSTRVFYNHDLHFIPI